MKIINSNRITDQKLSADICIIGAGPAGITLARSLCEKNLNIVIADSGSKDADPKANGLNLIRIESNFNYRNGESKRARQIGGTASLWAGRVVPYLFHPQLDSEWGEMPSGIRPFYGEALMQLNIHPGIQSEHYRSEDDFSAYWAFNTQRFKASSLTSLPDNVRIFSSLSFVGDAEFRNERIQSLTFLNSNKKQISISAERFIFAMGAIENTRMLLVMEDQLSKRMGDHFGNVGKYIMDHPRVYHGVLLPVGDDDKIKRHHMKTTSQGLYKIGKRNNPQKSRVYCDIKGSPNRYTRKVLKIPFRSFQYSAKKLQIRETGLLNTVASHASAAAPFKWVNLLSGAIKNFANNQAFSEYRIMTYCEQRPRIENEITLDQDTGRNGVPIPRLKNSIHIDELSEAASCYRQMEEMAEKIGYHFTYDENYVMKPEHYTDASHVMGGTRYSNDRSRAVVDENLSVIGVPNLHIAGSSLFPTSGLENPTHLITSLSLYLADTLKRNMY